MPINYAEIEKSLSVDPTPIVIENPIGSLFNDKTQHGNFRLERGNLVYGLAVFYRSEMTQCGTCFLFEDAVPKTKFRLTDAFKVGEFLKSAALPELKAYEHLIDACESAGRDAVNRFTGRDYVMGNGQVIGADGAFDCQVAAGFNSSSVRMRFGKHRVRVTVIGDQIVIVEE